MIDTKEAGTLAAKIRETLEKTGIRVVIVPRRDRVIEIIAASDIVPTRISYKVITSPGYFQGSVVGPDHKYFPQDLVGAAIMNVDEVLGTMGFDPIKSWSPLVEYRKNTPK